MVAIVPKDFETQLNTLQPALACTSTNLMIKCTLSFTALILRLQISGARRTAISCRLLTLSYKIAP